jgi:two-component system OmpR family sensor kinase
MRGLARWLAHRSVGCWSLRRRVLVVVIALVAAGMLATGVAATILLRSYLVGQVDGQIAIGVAAAERIGSAPRPHYRPPPTRTNDQLPTPLVLTQVDAAGRVVRTFGGSFASHAQLPDLSSVTATRVRDERGRAFTVPSRHGGSGFRVRAVQTSVGTIVVAISLHNADSTVHRLEEIIALVALAALVLIVVVGIAAVRLGLRPLGRVEEVAEQIAAGDLSRRVPQAESKTEIGRLSRSLNGMLAQIETAFAGRAHSEATLRRFVADAHHELRTPLTTIRGYAELLEKGAIPDHAEQRRAIERIDGEATRMGRLVDDLLLLAYLDQQRPLHMTPVDLVKLTQDAVADARARDLHRPISYRSELLDAYVVTDADRMRQVLSNLLDNAQRHTGPDVAVHVEVSKVDGHARVVVADEGPGIAPAHVAHLFERFYRADPHRSRAQGGSGLGLAIVEAVVQASSGTVTCQSAPGQGTVFTLTMPAQRHGLPVNSHVQANAIPAG